MQNFKELSFEEMVEVEGGGDPNGCSGCSAGVKVRKWISDFLSAMGRAGHPGQPGGNTYY